MKRAVLIVVMSIFNMTLIALLAKLLAFAIGQDNVLFGVLAILSVQATNAFVNWVLLTDEPAREE